MNAPPNPHPSPPPNPPQPFPTSLAPQKPSTALMGDDLAYALPMGIFLVLTWVGGTWPATYPATYVGKTIATAVALFLLRGHFTRIVWRYWWLGILVGIVGIVQWVGMETLILQYWPHYPRMSHEPYDPFAHFHSAAGAWSFIAVRIAGATLLVPVMEELFWRDFLWRTIIAPNDFKLAHIGEWDPAAFFVVALIFGAGVHIEWMTAIGWGLMIGLLLLVTRSLGACIIAHAVTNGLLGVYVLYTHQWQWW